MAVAAILNYGHCANLRHHRYVIAFYIGVATFPPNLVGVDEEVRQNRDGQDREHTQKKTFDVVVSSSSNKRQHKS